MAKMSGRAIVFNIAAIVVGGAAVAGAAKTWLVKPSVAPCETRYSNVLAFKLERDGRIVTPVDLQGRSGGRDLGLDRNLEIGAEPGAPKPVAMKVHLPAGDGAGISGMSFPWEPANIRPHTAACLTYNVRLSDNLDGSLEGLLPGLQGSADDGQQRFVVSPAWLKFNEAALATDIVLKRDPNEPAPAAQSLSVEGTEVALSKGRWLRVNQEVVLNAPEEENGIVRVWIDGKLLIDRKDMRLRNDAVVGFTGVAARAHAIGDSAKAASAGNSLSLTALELMW